MATEDLMAFGIISRNPLDFSLNSLITFWTMLVRSVFIALEVNRQFTSSLKSLNNFILIGRFNTFFPSYFKVWSSYEHRIIYVVWSTSFLPETWTLTNHDEESRRLALSVKQSRNGRVLFVSRFTILRIVLLVLSLAEELVVFWVVKILNLMKMTEM